MYTWILETSRAVRYASARPVASSDLQHRRVRRDVFDKGLVLEALLVVDLERHGVWVRTRGDNYGSLAPVQQELVQPKQEQRTIFRMLSTCRLLRSDNDFFRL